MQRNRPFAASQEFLSSSPDRSFPLLVQLGHSSVPDAREHSSDGGWQFRVVAVGCAAFADIGVLAVNDSRGLEAVIDRHRPKSIGMMRADTRIGRKLSLASRTKNTGPDIHR